MDRWDLYLQVTQNSKNTEGEYNCIKKEKCLISLLPCPFWHGHLVSDSPVLWMDKLVIAALSVTCAHTQRDGQDTESLGETHMDGYKT